MDRDAAIAQLAAKQHNAFTSAQAFGLGFSKSAINRKVKSGLWTNPHKSVYGIAGAPGSTRQQLKAAALATSAVISHTSAAYLHGVLERLAMPVHVTSATRIRKRKGIQPHQAELEKREIKRIDDIEVTSIERTIFDLGSHPALKSVFDDACQYGLTTIPKVTAYCEGKDCPPKLRKLLAERAKGPLHKALERLFVKKFKKTDLPEPKRHVKVGEYEVDFAYPALGIFIELDGWATHGSPSALQKDTRKQTTLVLAGYRWPLRFTWDDVNDDWDSYVVPAIREALAQSAA